MELINKQDAIKALRNTFLGDTYEIDVVACGAIECLKPVDAERVRHARLMIYHPYGNCSCCGELIDSRDNFNYCPNCGAKLDGDKHE